MSNQDTFWFHCGRCGSLFQAEAGEPGNRLCPKCGFDPSPGLAAAAVEPVKTAPTPPVKKTKSKKTHAKRSPGKTPSRHLMLKLIGGWTLFVVLIVLGARYRWHAADPEHSPALSSTHAKAAPVVSEEDAVLLQDSIQKCAESLSGFLSSGTPEGRNQFVLSPIATASRIARYYSQNPANDIDPKTLELTAKAVLHLPGARTIETLWKTKDGGQIDAIFREENGEWLLDWNHFVRYSDYPWDLFLAGFGLPEGEFRLLARERLAEERKDSDTISIVLYSPRFGHPDETGFQSPEFLVPRASRDGQLLDAALQLSRDHKHVFNSQLPALDPEGMVRIRVKIRRIETGLVREFEIAGITACHWYSLDDPGVQLPPL